MIAVRRAVASLLLVASACFVQAAEPAVDDWRSYLPSDWLAAFEVRDLASLEKRLPMLLKPWDRPAVPLRALLANFLPEATFTERPWGSALVLDADGRTTALLFVPTDDFEALCDSINADPAEDLAIATVSGFDLALQEYGGWVRISLLDSKFKDDHAAVPPPSAEDGNLRLSVSSAGWRAAAGFLKTRRRGQIAAGQGRVGPWKWPKGVASALDRLALYGPLAETLADYECPITVSVGFGPSEELQATITAPIVAPIPSEQVEAPAVMAEQPIAWAVSPGPLPRIVIDLSLAWTRCRPEDVEASEYPQPEWDTFAAAQRVMLEQYGSASYVLHLPAADEPVAANRVIEFIWEGDNESLGRALEAMSAAWNQLLKATDARSAAPFEFRRAPEIDGWKLSVDLFKQAGLESTPELEALFDRFYGHGGQMITEVVPSGERSWQTLMHPTYADHKALVRMPKPESDTLLRSEIYVHRMLAWKQRVDDIGKEKDIGRRVRPPMANTPPAQLTLTGGQALSADAVLPRATYEAVVRYWRNEKLPAVSER